MLLNRERLDRALAENKVDAVVAATFENVRYFTGIGSVSLKIHPYFGNCYAFVTAGSTGGAKLVSSVGEVDQVLDAFDGVEVRARGGGPRARAYRPR
jgi:Xaa-Pro aminopeptidase